ncbi:hypothetical protein OE88DRAFT_514929 [Heliocybe sulcata]|uniref:Uncharacterized protein n=1 Tax=Heliocybe sulcata TaxID=5364 RepID=A0A5C3MUX4_9AGAM|nr:hypothetical protein OE88DRAFT_514929 [Heliocybe sulcata]
MHGQRARISLLENSSICYPSYQRIVERSRYPSCSAVGCSSVSSDIRPSSRHLMSGSIERNSASLFPQVIHVTILVASTFHRALLQSQACYSCSRHHPIGSLVQIFGLYVTLLAVPHREPVHKAPSSRILALNTLVLASPLFIACWSNSAGLS